MLTLATCSHLQLGCLLNEDTSKLVFPWLVITILNKLNLMGLFNLKHSNWVFFTHKLCRKTWTECCFYMHNIQLLFFFFFKHFYTIHKEALTGKKEERFLRIRSTTTGRGGGHISEMLQATPEIWMLSGLPKQTGLFIQQSMVLFWFRCGN